MLLLTLSINWFIKPAAVQKRANFNLCVDNGDWFLVDQIFLQSIYNSDYM